MRTWVWCAMADVLTRLAQRGRGGYADVVPRVPALFEPSAGDTGPAADPGFVEEVSEIIAPRRPDPVPARAERPHRTAEAGPVETVRPAYPVMPIAPSERPRQRTPGEGTPSSEAAPVEPAGAGALVADAPAVRPVPVQPDSEPPHGIRPSVTAIPIPVAAPVSGVPRRAAATEAVSTGPAGQAPPAEPVVQISIGRIEIRAVAPTPASAAAPSAEAAAPASANAAGLSLSAYLRGDDGRPR